MVSFLEYTLLHVSHVNEECISTIPLLLPLGGASKITAFGFGGDFDDRRKCEPNCSPIKKNENKGCL